MKKLNMKKGANLEDIQEMNRSLILKLIRKYKVCTRAQLAKDTGLKQASITKIIASLIELGIVQELGVVEGERGRRSIGISINNHLYKFIGVKLSRKSFSIGVYDLFGEEYKFSSKSIDMSKGAKLTLNNMKRVVQKFLVEHADVAAIGIAIPGPFLKSKGRIALITELPGWENIDIQKEFTKAFTLPVFIEHDANAAALAEWWFSDNHFEHGVMVNFLAGEGVGAGIIIDGQLFSGSQGMAGEVGHMSIDFNGRKCSCGSFGCLEKYCTTYALVHHTKENLSVHAESVLNDGENITAERIFKAMDSGDELAIEMVKQMGRYMGFGIVNIVNAYNPNWIIISETMSRGGELLLDSIRETIKPRLISSVYENLTIQITEFANDSILYGAAAIAADHFLKSPNRYL
ncbi:ROK family transcriptional regulator [Bacillus sp. JJ1609]|uniref:ROK family transcriptional regulator n=1 Tax=Bacillus sp. JJ1609 TaxID=3122977 RepID=UPI0030009982